VEAVYQRFGLPLSGAAADAVRSLAAASATGQPADAAAHRYTLEEFGLAGEDVDERFAAYARAAGG
jgi:hypothetical protein